MEIVLLVIADMFLTYYVEGQITGRHWATLYHQMQFESLEACELYREAHAEQIGQEIGGPLRAFWVRELGVAARDLDVFVESECFEQ